MTKLLALAIACAACFYCPAQTYQLAPPLMKTGAVFFSATSQLRFEFRQPGAVIRYTTDGSLPSASSKRYSGPITVTNNRTIVQARSFAKGFRPSEPMGQQFWKNGAGFTVENCSKPNERYSAKGTASLNDNIGGSPALSNGNWLGFQSDTVTIDLSITYGKPVQEMMLDLLQAEDQWIFMPASVQWLAWNEARQAWDLMAEKKFNPEEPHAGSECQFTLLKAATAVQAKKQRVVMVPLQQLPDWHAGKGQPAWLFIDELKLY